MRVLVALLSVLPWLVPTDEICASSSTSRTQRADIEGKRSGPAVLRWTLRVGVLGALIVWLGCKLWLDPVPADTRPPVRAWLLTSTYSRAVLGEHESSALTRGASLVKLMTALVALRAVDASSKLTLHSLVPISRAAAEQPPTRLGLRPSDTLTLHEALLALFVRSANDAAVAIAELVAGSEARFVRLMNVAAAEMGMTDTRYVNPTGLPEAGQFTTAVDSTVLAEHLVREFPQARDIVSAISMAWKGRRLSRSPLIQRQGIAPLLLKTGFTCQSGYNFVGVFARADHIAETFTVVVLGAETSAARDLRSLSLLKSAFSLDLPQLGLGLYDLKPMEPGLLNESNLAARCRQRS